MVAYRRTSVDSKIDIKRLDQFMGCPGHASYNIHGNGLVEVNGVVPSFSGSTEARIREAWSKYGASLRGSARHYGFPATWLLGILMQESNGGKLNCSPCAACAAKHCSTHLGKTCCAFSIMQFLPSTAEAMGTNIEAIMADDSLAILTGAKLLSSLLNKYGGDIVKAAASYNAGSLRCGGKTTFGYKTNGDYPLDVIKWSNTALQMKLTTNKNALAFAIGAAGVFAAGAIYTGRWKPSWI